ncbi:type II toxin-antitoxin system VapC family toxin [Methylobacterium sp. SD21]|jgi:predicted nucleic acid-binding protein|uniref:type II toxin-antitoxin system VapC family toxin n=1 Tax=Methylobacterium litchii TaxID=3138810 RepID=UPI00313E3949
MPYLDTSVLVAALTAEPETARMQAWITAQNPDELTISPWVVTEFSAALSIKVRMGQLGPGQHETVLAVFSRLVADSFVMLPTADPVFDEAARLADRSETGLRAGDALHLAIAAGEGLVLATLDRKLAEAGRRLGMSTMLV